jgi:hypothetical protein
MTSSKRPAQSGHPFSTRGQLEFPAIGKLKLELYVDPLGDVATGDILTLTLLLQNASLRPMNGLVLAVPAPLGTMPVEQWLYQDAVRVREGAFFGEGTELAALAPGARTAFMWKLRVVEGEEPIRVVPQIWGAVTPIIGADPITVSRRVPFAAV